jgi:hypothetical protein
MKLSEAIRLGSLLVPQPEAGNIEACAITMACLSTGYVKSDRPMWEDWYSYIAETWPWTVKAAVACPCGRSHMMPPGDGLLHGFEVIWGVFDHHVMDDMFGCRMTIEQLADYIATIEPQDEPHEESRENNVREPQAAELRGLPVTQER